MIAERASEVALAVDGESLPDSSFGSSAVSALLQPTSQWPQWAKSEEPRATAAPTGRFQMDPAAMTALVVALCAQFGQQVVLAVNERCVCVRVHLTVPVEHL